MDTQDKDNNQDLFWEATALFGGKGSGVAGGATPSAINRRKQVAANMKAKGLHKKAAGASANKRYQDYVATTKSMESSRKKSVSAKKKAAKKKATKKTSKKTTAKKTGGSKPKGRTAKRKTAKRKK